MHWTADLIFAETKERSNREEYKFRFNNYHTRIYGASNSAKFEINSTNIIIFTMELKLVENY